MRKRTGAGMCCILLEEFANVTFPLIKRIPRGEKTMQADFVKKHRKTAKKVERKMGRQAGENVYAGRA